MSQPSSVHQSGVVAANRRPVQAAWYFVGFMLLTLAALWLRLIVLDRTNLDLIDHFLPWLQKIRDQGFWAAISKPFSEYGYTPFYSYAIGISDAILPAGTDGKIVIKSVSILFDFLAAGIVAAIARLRGVQAGGVLLAYAAVLFAPTVLLNGAYWGQSDIVYTTFLLGCLYFLLVQRPAWAISCFGMALAIKLQAAWLGPFILMLVLRGKVRWSLLLLVPVIYVLIALPSVYAGRSLLEVATIYLTQAGTQSALVYDAANLQFFPQYFFVHMGHWPDGVPIMAKLAVVFTALLSLAYAFITAKKMSGREVKPELLIVAALISVLFVPQFLPYMHNRYFFAADILAIVLAIWRPAYWPVALVMQFNSLVTYISFLWGTQLLANPVPSWLAIFGFTNNLQPVTGLEAFAGISNAWLLIWLWRKLSTALNAEKRAFES